MRSSKLALSPPCLPICLIFQPTRKRIAKTRNKIILLLLQKTAWKCYFRETRSWETLERLGLERPGSLLKSFVRLDEFSETVHGILMKLDTYVHLTVRFYKKLSGHLWHLWFKCHAHLKIPMLSLWRFYKVLQNLIFIKNPLLDFNYNFFKSKAQNVC